jgi:hypothetical protein
MKQACGCCTGIEVVTPQPEQNRPGLPALSYRAGTYATFFETMLARIASVYFDVPVPDGSGNLQRVYPLSGMVWKAGTLQKVSAGLSTRELSDPSIALLDAWATVADVLTFYQERIANEGYLRTAVERRSILELAKLVGYRLRPGVSSSVYLGFTVSSGFDGIIPAGTRAQSVPIGTGDKPQPFETYADLPARDVWNDIGPRLTRPQVITLATNPQAQMVTIDQGTDATTRDTLYFKGISTNLKTGDALLIVSGEGGGEQALRMVESVNAQADQQRTEVTLLEPPFTLQGSTVTGGPAQQAVASLQSALEPFIADAAILFNGGDLASQVAAVLQQLISDATALAGNTATAASDIADLIVPVIPQIQDKHDIAVRRGFTRLEPWITDANNTLAALLQQIPNLDDTRRGSISESTNLGETVPASLGSLYSIVDRLALPPSLQPANSFRLARNVRQVFAPQSDTAPRLLAAFHPVIAPTLYKAWGSIEAPSTPIQVYAMRVKAGPFGNNAPLMVTYSDGTPSFSDWPIVEKNATGAAGVSGPSHETDYLVSLDSNYDKVLPDSWLVLDTSAVDRTQTKIVVGPQSPGLLFAKAGTVSSVSRGDYGMSGKATRISLIDPATSERLNWLDTSQAAFGSPTDFIAIRQTIVYAQPEELELAEEPLDRDVEGGTIELDSLYDGLESGRWIIVSGERTDITDSSGSTNATGVTGNELVMIAQVTQGAGKQSCMPLNVQGIPFDSIYAIAGPNSDGDLLVVGHPAPGFKEFLSNFPLPTISGRSQQICSPMQLAPGVYANAYIPTAAEKQHGDFRAFAGLLLDPGTGQLFSPDGIIDTSRFDPGNTADKFPLYPWRISNFASGADTLHTNLVLANDLAYSYDAGTVTIYGNVAKATHGQTQGEVLGDGDASQPLQSFQLHQSPLTYLPAPTPSGAESTLAVTVNEIEWQEDDNLFVAGPTDRIYVTQTDDSAITSVITGDGEHGLRVPSGTANVKATYRSGTGQVGNVEALQISQLATQPLGVKSVINPLAAGGGADADTRDQARRNIPIGLTALDRLVSVQDYADFARKFAGIGKASSRRLTDGRKLVVYLTIAGKDDVPIDPTTDLYQALILALADAGDPHQPVQVALRRLRLLVLSAGVKIQPAYTWELVAANLRSTLLALYSFDNRDLGQTAFLSEAVSAMQAVAGVQYVDMRVFDSVPESVTATDLANLASTFSTNEPKSFVQAELASVDPTATDPTQRIRPAELVILTPDIPDTLILTEITT